VILWVKFSYVARGGVYRGRKEYDRAFADFNEAIRLDPKYAPAYGGRGDAYMGKKEYDHAIADYTEAIRLDPKYDPAYGGRGNAYMEKKEYDRAIADYTEAFRLRPGYYYYTSNRVKAYIAKNDYDNAIGAYTEAIRFQNNPNSNYYMDRAKLYEAQKDYKSAIADYTTAIAIDRNWFIYKNRGLAYYNDGQYRNAVEDLEGYVDNIKYWKYTFEKNEAIEVYGKLSIAYAGIDINKSNKYLGELISLEPNNPDNYRERLRRLLPRRTAGKYEATNFFELFGPGHYVFGAYYSEVIADYTQLIRLEPNNIDNYRGRGIEYARDRQYKEAVADFTQVLRLEPNNADLYCERGEMYRIQYLASEKVNDNSYNLAQSDFQAALRINPNHQKAKNGIAKLSDDKKWIADKPKRDAAEAEAWATLFGMAADKLYGGGSSSSSGSAGVKEDYWVEGYCDVTDRYGKTERYTIKEAVKATSQGDARQQVESAIRNKYPTANNINITRIWR